MSNQKMKLCPFCGSDFLGVSTEGTSMAGDNGWWVAGCGNPPCMAHTKRFPTKEQAITAWNQRIEIGGF